MKTIETLGELAAKQTIRTDPMRDLLEKYGPDQNVEVTRMVTPWGTFLAGIKIVEETA